MCGDSITITRHFLDACDVVIGYHGWSMCAPNALLERWFCARCSGKMMSEKMKNDMPNV